MTYDQLMNWLFYICVDILRWGAKHLGMTYEELNIWVFVVIHPALTLLLLGTTVYYWRKAAHSQHIQCLSSNKKPQVC